MINNSVLLRKYLPFLLLGGLGFLARMPWIDLGLPQQYYPDEWAYFTTAFKFIKLHVVDTGVAIPNGFMYLIFIGYCIGALFLFLSGDVHSFKEYYASFYSYGDPYLDYANPHFLVIARLTSAVITVGCGILIGIYVQRHHSQRTAFLTTALFYLLPTEFLYSRFGLPDNSLMAAMFIGIITIERFIDKPGTLRWAAACGAAVLAISIKSSGAMLVVPLVFSLWKLRNRAERPSIIRFAVVAAIVFIAGSVVLFPNLIFSSVNMTLIKGFIYVIGPGHRTDLEAFHHDSNTPFWQYFYYLYFDYGPVLLSIGLFGLYGLCKKSMNKTLVWLLVIVPFFVVFQCASAKMSRYIIPVTSLFFILAFPAGFEALCARRPFKKPFVYAGLVAALFVYPVFRVVAFYSAWSHGDTRREARAWLEHHDYAAMKFAREIHDTPLLPSHYAKPVLECWNCGKYSIGELKKMGVDMVMISGSYLSFLPESRTFKNYQSYFDSLRLVTTFNRRRGDAGIIASNPVIMIFQVQKAGKADD